MRTAPPPDGVDLHASLVRQLDNCADFWEGFGRVHEDPDGARWFRSGVALPEINGIRRPPTLDAAEVAERVRRALEDLPWTWWVAGDGAQEVERALQHLGFVRVEEMPHLAIATDAPMRPAPPGLRIRTVAAGDVDEFVDRWTANFGIPAEYVDQIAQRDHDRPLREQQCTYLAGFVDDRMAATALLLSADGVGGIYCVTTDPRFRRRGLGRAMTAAAVTAAREQGLPVASLQATPEGLPLYRSMGFVELARYAVLAIAPAADAGAGR